MATPEDCFFHCDDDLDCNQAVYEVSIIDGTPTAQCWEGANWMDQSQKPKETTTKRLAAKAIETYCYSKIKWGDLPETGAPHFQAPGNFKLPPV